MTFRQFILQAAAAASITLSPLAAASSDADIVVKASLDSATLEMGRVTAIHVEVFGTIDAADSTATDLIMDLPDSIRKSIEIAGMTPPEITDLGNGRARLRRDIIIQGFDSGAYTLPPVIYRGGDSAFESNQCVIKVYPTPVDSLKTINDYAGTVEPRRLILDYLPDWMARYGIWILLAIVIIALAAYIIIMRRRGTAIIPKVPAKKESPVDAALRQLSELREENLCQRGEEKQYYTRLTDILRVYLHDRFGINAMEMTSTQIRRAVADNETTRMSRDAMSSILEMADFVKFAKVRPLPDDNIAAMNKAVKFVDDTRPAPEPENPGTDTDDGFEDKDNTNESPAKPSNNISKS